MKRLGLAMLATAAMAVGCAGAGHEAPRATSTQPPAVTKTPVGDARSNAAPSAAAMGAASPVAATSAKTATSAAPTGATTASPDFGAERYRMVSRADEIVSVLNNGMVVIVKRVPSPVCAVRAYVHAGSVYEGQWMGGGLSHLLEHLVAGGSTHRRTEAENRSLLQAIGNDSNAYTTMDHTAYFVNTTPDHMDQAVDLVSGWVLGALITPAEYAREYEVVQRELEKGKGEPMRAFYYMAARNRYRVGPAGVPTIGYQQVIQGLSRDDVFSYYKEAYAPNNMVFCVAADLDPEAMLAAVRKNVNDAAPQRDFSHDITAEPPVVAPRTAVATFPKLGQARLELAFPTIRLQDDDLYALDLLSAALSGGDSAILVEEMRDKQKLVTAVDSSSYTPSFVPGSFSFDMQLDPKNIEPATAAVMAIIDQVKADGIDPNRLERAKTQMRVGRVMQLQGAEAVAASMGTDMLSTGDPHFSDVYVDRIKAVTPAQVKAVAQKYFDRQRLLTTVLLPAEAVGAAGLPAAVEMIRPATATTRRSASAEGSAKVTRVELDNGVILLHKRIATAPLVTMQMYALGGLTAEDAKTNGLGNLTMEMLPRGTKDHTAQQIAEFFDSIGGSINTGCGNNSWYWQTTCMAEDADKTAAMLGDVVANPSFPADELGTMKKRVLAAIAGQDADWTGQAFRFFKQKYFGPSGSPYQFTAIGTEANVNAATPEELSKWYADRVLKSRRVVAIYGDIDLDHAKKLAAGQFGKGAKVDATAPARPDANAATVPASGDAGATTPHVVIERVETQKTAQPLAGVVIGYDAHGVIGEAATFPLAVADTMTSGYSYPTGYLHETLRGLGLVYVVHAVNQPGVSAKTPGTFLVYAGCDPKNVNQVVDLILENIARVQGTDADMQADWFDRSKGLIAITEAMNNETAGEQASTAALDELYGLGYRYHDRFAAGIDTVSLDDVRRVAGGRLGKCVVTISTPAPELVKIEPGRRDYSSFPPVDLTPKGVQHDSPGAR